jgi:hypothetical protein
LGVGPGANNLPTIKTLTCHETYHTASYQDRFFGKMTKAPKNGYEIGTWNVRSLYRIGSLKTLSRELGKYKLDLIGVQEVRWEKGGTERAEDYTFSVDGGMGIIS